MTSSSYFFEAPRRLRAFVRAHETSLVVLAALTGLGAGLVVAAMSPLVTLLHAVFFDIGPGERLSGQMTIDPLAAIGAPMFGGLILGIAVLLVVRRRPEREIDPIEANA